jgi:hypothetical protein
LLPINYKQIEYFSNIIITGAAGFIEAVWQAILITGFENLILVDEFDETIKN